ncbi:hypothetical protein Tco_1449326 [Tanacetum coccineum]
MSLHGFTDDVFENSVHSDTDNVTLISKLDVCHPLRLHPNDFSTLTVVSIKLKGTENYYINSLSQNGAPIADYFNKLSTLWKQFDALVQLPRDPLPDAEGAYVIISSKGSHRAVVTGSGAGTFQRFQSSVFNSSVTK